MASTSTGSAAAASATALPKVTTTVKLIGIAGAAPTGFKLDYGDTVGVLAGLVGDKFNHFVYPGTVHLYQVPDSKRDAALFAFIKDAEDARTNYGVGDPIKPDVTLTANSFLLAIGNLTPAAAPSSATGKCPHSIVFPSVARSSLT
jgi:hypothetical protein